MKKVAALTNDLKNQNDLIFNIVDSGIVNSEDDIVIINIKESRINIINTNRGTMVINAALGDVIDYIKHAEYVYIDGRYMLNNHLVQYLLTFTTPEQVLNDIITAVDEGTDLNNATDMIEKFLTDRKEYKRKLTKKNVVCGLIERKMVAVFNHDKLTIGAPYDITFTCDTVITNYDGKSFKFKGGATHTGIFFKGGETFLSFTLIGPEHFPTIVKLKPDMLFYIMEYNNHNEM